MRQGTEDIYIDESGSGAVYEPPPHYYQFFNMSGVVISDDNERKLSSEIRKWKKSYLKNSNSILHTVDYFEDFKEESSTNYIYKKQILQNSIKFFKATSELLAIFRSIKFKSKVYYIDLFELRKALGFDKLIPPKENKLKLEIINNYKGQYLQPISTIIRHLFIYHDSLISEGKRPGYICFESQREFDVNTVKTFHQVSHGQGLIGNKIRYGQHILGLNFYTKASLCSALELSDFISYCSTQFLRNEINSKELTILPDRLSVLLEAYKSLKREYHIILRNVTDDCIKEYKALYKPQKKARK